MKTKLLKLALPIGMGLVLLIITLMGMLSTTLTGCKTSACGTGELLGTDGKCYGPCPGGYYASLTASAGNCGSPSAGGVYCCGGGSGSGTGGGAHCNSGYTYNYSSQKCCPNNTPYYYPGTHGITAAGCYASCPYVGDCGSSYTKY
jgi:hypothetical protein